MIKKINSSYRIYRGGSWYHHDFYCEVGGVFYNLPYYRDSHVGFRVFRRTYE